MGDLFHRFVIRQEKPAFFFFFSACTLLDDAVQRKEQQLPLELPCERLPGSITAQLQSLLLQASEAERPAQKHTHRGLHNQLFWGKTTQQGETRSALKLSN